VIVYDINLVNLFLQIPTQDARVRVGHHPYTSCKIVLCGHHNVGKTSIVEKYVYDKFEENPQSGNNVSYPFKLLLQNLVVHCIVCEH